MCLYRAYTVYNARDTALCVCNDHEATIAVEKRPRITLCNRLRYRRRAQRKSPMNSKPINYRRSKQKCRHWYDGHLLSRTIRNLAAHAEELSAPTHRLLAVDLGACAQQEGFHSGPNRRWVLRRTTSYYDHHDRAYLRIVAGDRGDNSGDHPDDHRAILRDSRAILRDLHIVPRGVGDDDLPASRTTRNRHYVGDHCCRCHGRHRSRDADTVLVHFV